jgi:pyruvate/2-oxoglutarate dehydrogenase complex dihydrolipoamide dehydrogenase (E3) component
VTRAADLIVIGGGAAGITAAREGARRGARTVLVQDGPPGGECTFSGCVPSKALLAVAEADGSWADARQAIDRSISTIAATEDAAALSREHIEVLAGRASLRSGSEISVDGTLVRASQIVLATGSSPVVPPIPGLDSIDVLTNESVFRLDRQPASMVILGGGPVGCEMAEAFARLGTTVTVIEQIDRLLPRDEPEAAAVVRRSLEARRVTVRSSTTVTRAEPIAGGARLHLSDGVTVDAERIFVAAGRRAVTAGLGLAEAGVAVDERGSIVVHDTMATSLHGVWAIGDVTGLMQLTHAAGQMAHIAVSNALKPRFDPRRRRFDPLLVPWATFTQPEVAHVGLTEEAAATTTTGARVAFVPLTEVDRAITSDHTDGFVKLIAGPRRVTGNAGGGRLLGATIVAPRAGEMIHEPALAMTTRMFTGRLAQAVHAYPTWSMAVQQAALQFFFETGGRSARPAIADTTIGATEPMPT